jgi:hypothetical protein
MKIVTRMTFPEDVQRVLPQPVAFVTPYLQKYSKNTHTFSLTQTNTQQYWQAGNRKSVAVWG